MLPCGVGNQAWLISMFGSDRGTRTFINPLTATIEEMKIPEMEGQMCFGCFEEWLFLVDEQNDCFLLNIYSLTRIHLPSIGEPPAPVAAYTTLTSSPTSSDCTIILFGSEENFLLFCRPCDKEWTKLPVDFDVTQVGRKLMYKGRLYVILERSIQIIDLASLAKNCLETNYSSMDKPSFHSFGMGCAEHLVESCGDLFYVQTCLPGTQTLSIIDLAIFKLDFSSQGTRWVRVESIGDRAFFLDQLGGQSFCASIAQLDQNCIYQMVPRCYDGKRLYKICLDNQMINFDVLNNIEGQGCFCWVLPVRQPVKFNLFTPSATTVVCSEIYQNDVRELKEQENKEEYAISMPLADLTIDMVQLISEKLTLKDSVRLRVVCKQWTNLINPIKGDQVWLMYCPLKSGTCQMYNPFQGKELTLNLNKLSSGELIRLLFSKDGWVLAQVGDYQLYLLNPFTNNIHHLPRLAYKHRRVNFSFSFAPNSANCVIFAIAGSNRGEITTIMAWHYGQKMWFQMKFINEVPFHMADNNPVFMDNEFYCLGKMGNLGVFNSEKCTWRILDKPSSIHSEAPEIGKDQEYCYLLECNGELLSVFQSIDMIYVRVYKLDRIKMAWTSLEDLGNLTLFLDFRTSIAKALPCKSYSNKLYLPRVCNGTSKATFYYCMKTRMYSSSFKNLSVPYNCLWLEPNLNG